MDERSRRIEARFKPVVIAAALLVIVFIAIDESSLGEPWDSIGVALNWGSWLVFLAELVVMLAVVPDRGRWIREHPLEVAIVVLTPPFVAGLASVRLLQLLRLLPLLRLARVARQMLSPQGLRYAAALVGLVLVGSGAAFSELEGVSTAEGLYWAVTTLTTVGYGDVVPTTVATKALAAVVMLVGIGFLAILTGAIAERLLARDIAHEEEDLEAEFDEASEAILRELQDVRGRLGALESTLRRRAG